MLKSTKAGLEKKVETASRHHDRCRGSKTFVRKEAQKFWIISFRKKVLKRGHSER